MWKSRSVYPNRRSSDEFWLQNWLPVILTEDEEGPKNVLRDILIPKAMQAFHQAEESPSYILQISEAEFVMCPAHITNNAIYFGERVSRAA